MDRRHFIRFGLVGLGTGIVAPKITLAAAAQASVAGGIYYTKDAPGRWSKKVSGHLPNLQVQKAGTDSVIEVITGHEMKGFEHYIVKHVLLDKDFKFIAENLFNPATDKQPISKFTVSGYSGPIHALSVCNRHDTWLNTIEV